MALLSLSMAKRVDELQTEQVNSHKENITDLEQSNKIKDEFLATISHVLRTPMNGVIGGVELIRCTELTKEQSTYINIGERFSA